MVDNSIYNKIIDGKEIFFRKNSGDEAIFNGIYINNEYKIDYIFNEYDVVIDIGAHTGSFSLLCHKLGCKHIYAYEANTDNYSLLKRNVEGINEIHAFNKVVWKSENHNDKFYLSELNYPELFCANSGAIDVLYPGNPKKENIEIETIGLDNIIDIIYNETGINKIKQLKIDCEGSEFPILYTCKYFNKIEKIVGELHEIKPENGGFDFYLITRFKNKPTSFDSLNIETNYNSFINFLSKQNYNVKTHQYTQMLYAFWCEKI